MTTHRILRLPAALERCGYSRSTLYQRIADGLWTHPVPIGERAVGWPESEVSALIAARIAGLPAAEIRQLVQQLEAARTALRTAALPA